MIKNKKKAELKKVDHLKTEIEEISSLSNPKIKKIVKLLKDAKLRQLEDLVLVDGLREIEEASNNGWILEEFYYCLNFINEKDQKKLELLTKKSKKVYNLTTKAFEKISYKKNPDGFLAVIRSKTKKLKEVKVKKDPLILVLESVEKPGNLGAIIRTAHAAGIDLIILNDQKTDLFSPNVIRSSTGFIFSMPLVIASIPETIDWLNKNKVKILTTSISAKQNHFKMNLKKGVAIVFGSEAFGLSDLWLKSDNEQVKIPMIDGVDSLNVSVSAAIIIYEAIRQRKFI